MSEIRAFLDAAQARITMSALVGRTVTLKKAGREFKGLCAWHADKHPSMTVNDEKGFAHCFACGGHADAAAWLTQVEGMEWRDALAELAALSGVPLPAPSPKARAAAERQAALRPTLEAVQEKMRAALSVAVRDWVRSGRGFDDAIIDEFGLGYAPPGEAWLREAVASGQMDTRALIGCGAMGESEGGFRYVRMKHRLTIPIHDARGQMIGHGGRLLPVDLAEPGAKLRGDAPKYLNSPETALFDKGRVLFNQHRARPLVKPDCPPLVVEGYFDVMRLHALGLPALAPMGTALTPAQLTALWRMHACPVLVFDGDAAGRAAAGRACVAALPGIGPGRSLAVALLPPGMDPDDLGQQGGRPALDAVVAEARPMSDFLFEMAVAA